MLPLSRVSAPTDSSQMTGVVAGVGGIPNAFWHSPQLVPYLLTGNPIPQRVLETHIFTEVVPADQVLPTALKWAKQITDASPEAVWVTKEQINMHKTGMGVGDIVYASLDTEQSQKLYRGANIQEGLRSFVEVRLLLYVRRRPQLTCLSGGVCRSENRCGRTRPLCPSRGRRACRLLRRLLEERMAISTYVRTVCVAWSRSARRRERRGAGAMQASQRLDYRA